MMMARERYGLDGVMSHGDFISLGREGCSRYPFVSGHFGYGFAEPLLKGRYAFTFLRDPVERLISLYWFSRAQTGDNILYNAAKRFSFDEFLKLGRCLEGEASHPLRPQIWNNQTYQLAHGYGSNVGIDDCEPKTLLSTAKRNLRSFDYIGFTETLSSDAAKIFQSIGGSSTVTTNKTNVTERRPALEHLSSCSVALLKEMTELDRELYANAQAYQQSRPWRWWMPIRSTNIV